MEDIRCSKCNKLLGKIKGEFEIKFNRCGNIEKNKNTDKESVKDDNE